jgi:hypothetical protein
MTALEKLADLGEIYIPVIEIEDGWAADSMESIEECEDATIKCNVLIAEIEFQIDMFETKPAIDRDYGWLARAKRALKYKKIAAQCVNNCRSRIVKEEKRALQNSYDRRVLDQLKAHVEPELWSKCVKLAAVTEDVDA